MVGSHNAVACGVCVGADSFIAAKTTRGLLDQRSDDVVEITDVEGDTGNARSSKVREMKWRKGLSGDHNINTQMGRRMDDLPEFDLLEEDVEMLTLEDLPQLRGEDAVGEYLTSTGVKGVNAAAKDGMTPVASSRGIGGGGGGVTNNPSNPSGLLLHKKKMVHEINRLKCLRDYMILDSESEPRFERITALASRIFDVDIALISLVDIGRQWFMSNRGLGDTKESDRKVSYC